MDLFMTVTTKYLWKSFRVVRHRKSQDDEIVHITENGDVVRNQVYGSHQIEQGSVGHQLIERMEIFGLEHFHERRNAFFPFSSPILKGKNLFPASLDFLLPLGAPTDLRQAP